GHDEGMLQAAFCLLWAHGKQHHIHEPLRNGGRQHVRVMAGNSLEPRLHSTDSVVELLQTATGSSDVCPGCQCRQIMEDKQVGVIHLETCEARLNLWDYGLLQSVDLVDHEHARTIPFKRLPDDLLAIPLGVAGGSVNKLRPPAGSVRMISRN